MRSNTNRFSRFVMRHKYIISSIIGIGILVFSIDLIKDSWFWGILTIATGAAFVTFPAFTADFWENWIRRP